MSSNDANLSKRKHVRYAVSDDCRLKVAIRLRSADQATAGKDWPGMLVDMSAEGMHIQISLGAVASLGDSCVVKLALGTMKTEFRGILAHYVCSARYSVCGVRFDFHVSGADGPYLPYYKAIVASSTLKGGPTDSDVVGKYREEYRGPGHVKLVLWRDNKPERAIVAFDYAMARYSAVLGAAGTDMFKTKAAVNFTTAPTEKGGHGSALTASQEAEARWEFSLAASNLPAAVPPDVRSFLRLMS